MLYIPVALLFIPVVTAIVIYLFKSKQMNYLVLVAQAAITVLAILYYNYFSNDLSQTFFVFGDWHPLIGISLHNDAISMSFVFLTIFTWWMILLYTFNKDATDHTFLFFLLFLEGVFLGILQTNDLFNMFVFVELTTIIATILIAFKKSGKAFRAAIYYLLLNTSGVLAFLIGMIFVYNTFGTINILAITELLEDQNIAQSTVMRFAYLLMMAGISVKAAFFPVFTWLPKAHGAAQAAISALLSGLIVKGGLYLFIRINMMFGAANFAYNDFFFVVGVLTASIGIIFALTQTDIKQMLAYSTVSQVGIILVALSSTDTQVFYGGLFHIFNHAMFKALLFLVAGIIIKVYRTQDINQMHGVFKSLPVLSVVMIIGMLAITGAPLLNGFISKSIILYGFETMRLRYWILFSINIGTATLFIKMASIFIGPKVLSYPMRKHFQTMSLFILALGCILLGAFYLPIGEGFFGITFSQLNALSLAALFDYSVTLSIAFLLYYFVLRKDGRLIKRLRNFELSFESASFLFVAYLVALTLYFGFFTA